MTQQSKLRALSRVLGSVAEVHGNEHLFYCPFHAHHKPKLSINIDLEVWKCWVCNRRGLNLLRLLRLKGETEDSIEYKKSLKSNKIEEPKRNYEIPVLPKEFRTLTKSWNSPYYNHAISYLRSRNVSIGDIFRYKIGYCESGIYQYRIVFPSFDSFGELNFVIGRSFYGGNRAYYHGEYDKNIIFNEYLVDWGEPVILVEGIFDAIIAGNNSIPRLGSTLTENSRLFAALLKSPDIYLAFDTDAFDKQLDIVSLLIEYGKKPLIVDLNGAKDPGVMDKDAFGRAKSLAKRVNSEFDLLRLRVK